jgi:hypothetical protein
MVQAVVHYVKLDAAVSAQVLTLTWIVCAVMSAEH